MFTLELLRSACEGQRVVAKAPELPSIATDATTGRSRAPRPAREGQISTRKNAASFLSAFRGHLAEEDEDDHQS
jgi:hypothetical protein